MKKKEFRLPDVSFYTDNKRVVVAVVTFNDKRLRAIAKCSPEDSFDYETGKKIAYDRVLFKFFKEKYKSLCEYADAWRVIKNQCSDKIGSTIQCLNYTVDGYASYLGVTADEVIDKFSK